MARGIKILVLARWAAHSANLNTITLIFEERPIWIFKDSNLRKAIGFNEDAVAATPVVQYQVSHSPLPKQKTEIVEMFKEE